MDTWMPASLVGRDLIVRERQERLRAEARDERLARAARKPRSSPRTWSKGFSMVARTPGVGAVEGTD